MFQAVRLAAVSEAPDVARLVDCAPEDDGYLPEIRIASQFANKFDTCHDAEHYVRDDEVGSCRWDECQGGFAVWSVEHSVIERIE